jgi:hypothetical protein
MGHTYDVTLAKIIEVTFFTPREGAGTAKR